MSRFSSTNQGFFLRFYGLFRHFPLLCLGAVWVATGPLVEGMDAHAGFKINPEIHAGLARVDSLVASNQIPLAHNEIMALYSKFSSDGHYGGKISSRVGLTMIRLGQTAEAIPFLEEAIQKDPAPPEYHRNLGFALLELGRRGRALSEYAQAVEMDPGNFEFRLEYGQLLLDFGDPRRAGPHLLEADRLCHQCPELKEPLARYYLADGRFQKAAELLMDLHRQNPSPQTRRTLIQALRSAQDSTTLMKVLSEGDVALLPEDEAQLLVDVEGELGQWAWSQLFSRTLTQETNAPSVTPLSVQNSSPFWGRVSYNLLQANQNNLALVAVDRAIALAPENVVYRNNRVVLLIQLERHDEARLEWEKVLDLDPSMKAREK